MPVEIAFKKIKRINLRVTDGKVKVSAPYSTRLEAVENFVLKNLNWIDKQLSRVSLREDEAYYLGKLYKVNVIDGAEGVKITEEEIVVSVPQGDFETAKRFFQIWWKGRADIYFKTKTEEIFSDCAATLGLKKYPKIIVTKVRGYWGNCCPSKNVIRLNCCLLQADEEAIRYVIYHELTHLKHLRHDKNFYLALNDVFPQASEAKRRLKAYRTELR